MQTVIDKLRDLSATKFADKMAGTQTAHHRRHLRRQPSHRKGHHQQGRRRIRRTARGEPAVYVMDAKSIDDLQKAIAGIKPASGCRTPQKK